MPTPSKKKPPLTPAQKKAQDFRKTAAGVNLGKMLFDGNLQRLLNPKKITDLLRAAGLNIPPGVEIGADIAQIIMAGGSIIDNAQKGADVAQIVGATSSQIRACMTLFEKCGLVNMDTPIAQAIVIGVDGALVISNGGANVYEDLRLVMDFVLPLIKGVPDRTPQIQAELDRKNFARFQGWYQDKLQGEMSAATRDFASYQSGKLSAFEMLGAVASDAPELFLNFFPEYGGFIPPVVMTKEFIDEHHETVKGGLFRLQERRYDIIVRSVFKYSTIRNDKSSLQQAFLDKFIYTPCEPYHRMSTLTEREMKSFGYSSQGLVKSHDNPVYPRIHFSDLALLSMFPPYFDFVHADFDIRPYLFSLNLTPNDLGYSIIEDEMRQGAFGEKPKPVNHAISFNGIEQPMKQDASYAKVLAEHTYVTQKVSDLDRSGDIRSLLGNSKASQIIAEWGTIPFIPDEETRQTATGGVNLRNPQAPLQSPGLSPNVSKSFHRNPKGYRNIQNYWSAVSVAKSVLADPYFKGINFSALETYIADADSLTERHRELQFKSVSRKLNLVSKETVAGFFGLPASKLKLSPPEPGKLTRVI